MKTAPENVSRKEGTKKTAKSYGSLIYDKNKLIAEGCNLGYTSFQNEYLDDFSISTGARELYELLTRIALRDIMEHGKPGHQDFQCSYEHIREEYTKRGRKKPPAKSTLIEYIKKLKAAGYIETKKYHSVYVDGHTITPMDITIKQISSKANEKIAAYMLQQNGII